MEIGVHFFICQENPTCTKITNKKEMENFACNIKNAIRSEQTKKQYEIEVVSNYLLKNRGMKLLCYTDILDKNNITLIVYIRVFMYIPFSLYTKTINFLYPYECGFLKLEPEDWNIEYVKYNILTHTSTIEHKKTIYNKTIHEKTIHDKTIHEKTIIKNKTSRRQLINRKLLVSNLIQNNNN
jgi:hypothetical protein